MAPESELHERLLGEIDAANPGLPEHIRRAFRTLQRSQFVPGVELAAAYADDSVLLRRWDNPGGPSSSSQPSLMAAMLNQLDLRRGQSVLEIGTGSGYNAALISEIVGPDGSVRTIEVQADVAQAASAAIRASGHGNVVVATGDALLPEAIGGQTFDRIIATCSVSDLSPAWTDALAPDGRAVVPLRLRGGIQASVALVPQRDESLTGFSCVACGFMPLRSVVDPSLGAVYAFWNLPFGPSKVLSCSGPAPDPDLVCTWLDGGWSDRQAHAPVSGFRVWLAVTEPSVITVQQDTNESERWPWLASHGASGLATDDGLALLVDDETIRSFGSPAAAERLESCIAAWVAAGQPGAESLDVRLVPHGTVPGALTRRHHDLVVRWRES